jgi:hypothetical protein
VSVDSEMYQRIGYRVVLVVSKEQKLSTNDFVKGRVEVGRGCCKRDCAGERAWRRVSFVAYELAAPFVQLAAQCGNTLNRFDQLTDHCDAEI